MSILIPFTKMQGAGNDYIYLNLIDPEVSKNLLLCDFNQLAKSFSNRNFSIGSDGLVLISESEDADFTMTMFNADGTESAMCGNAIRCVAKFVYDHNYTNETRIQIETQDGIKAIDLIAKDGVASAARVNMGIPKFAAKEIPSSLEGDSVLDHFITLGELVLNINLCNMGNPHCVIFSDKVSQVPLEQCGPIIEHSYLFPERANVEFVEIIELHHVKQRTWERGSGETLACGTGAAAVAAVGIRTGRMASPVKVELLGGDLTIEWAGEGQPLYMIGPAREVYSGTIAYPKGI